MSTLQPCQMQGKRLHSSGELILMSLSDPDTCPRTTGVTEEEDVDIRNKPKTIAEYFGKSNRYFSSLSK